ncbi:MAG: type 4a pilus biogenesis protein PilO [Nitrospirae bacterium]|nr:type 4a pilus biogenesis protein PilO [Nitrospirota bacterium]
MAFKLDIKFDIKKLPKGARIGIAVAPAVIILVIVIMLIVVPKTKEIKQLKTDISAQENEIQKSQAMAAKLDILKVENEKLKRRLAELKEQLPEGNEVSSLLKQISAVAAKSDVDMQTWRPEGKKAHPSGIVEEIPFSITLTGTYHQLGYFFSNITRLNRIVNFSDIKMGGPQARKDDAMLTISFRASTFSSVQEEAKDKGGK